MRGCSGARRVSGRGVGVKVGNVRRVRWKGEDLVVQKRVSGKGVDVKVGRVRRVRWK